MSRRRTCSRAASRTGSRRAAPPRAGCFADYKLPAELVVLDALPRTASGKVQKAQLRPRNPQ